MTNISEIEEKTVDPVPYGQVVDELQEICGVGYVNGDKKHVLISIRHPSLTNRWGREEIIQFAVTIEKAKELTDKINTFLVNHNADDPMPREIADALSRWTDAVDIIDVDDGSRLLVETTIKRRRLYRDGGPHRFEEEAPQNVCG